MAKFPLSPVGHPAQLLEFEDADGRGKAGTGFEFPRHKVPIGHREAPARNFAAWVRFASGDPRAC